MVDTNRLKDHSYDGIHEYDNDLPRWWLVLLYGCIAWAGLYVVIFHAGPGLLGPEALRVELLAIAEQRAHSATGPLSEDLLRQMSHNTARRAKGEALFQSSQCALCHGPTATGNIGPNLRDDWWIYGSNMTDLVETITNGRFGGAMPPQAKNLSADDIASLAVYIAELNRTSKADGKPHDPKREHLQPITY